jgi:hypothetical protein
MPTEDQLKLAVQFLFKKGVLDPNIKITVREPDYEGGGNKEVPLKSFVSENPNIILDSYPLAIKRTPEYIESRRKAEAEFQLKVEQLKAQCPQTFLNQPITELLPNFKAPSHKGRVEYGEVTQENKKWKALMINGWADLPSTITQAPNTSFAWNKNQVTTSALQTTPQNGMVTRYTACKYSIHGVGKSFNFYLIPVELTQAFPKEESPQIHKTNTKEEKTITSSKVKMACPNLTPDDINSAMHILGLDHYHHIPSGNIAVIQKGEHKYRLNFTSATHVDVPGAKVVITQDSHELPFGKYVCKYVTQNGDGGHNGDFELALEK